ncbi:MAG: hypothetical protein DME65_00860 [Verrucomicrobia bacterium]|nr:MAG: hypothetical protein DME65_00860 [Verrucomicrobiota bacterium]
MQIKKRVLCAERVRKVPPQFSWVDQRLVRQGYVQRCEHAALALYLVLVTVADAEGLSYYSDASLERMLRLEHAGLCAARSELAAAGLVVYQKPLYQVLALERPEALPGPRSGQTRSLKEVLAQALEKGVQS